jgi:hypothetical protein
LETCLDQILGERRKSSSSFSKVDGAGIDLGKVEYLACILCGKTIVKDKFKSEPFSIAPTDFRILQVRDQVGGRKGQGFFDVPEEGRTILDLWKGSKADRSIAECLKERLLTVLKDYLDHGIISVSELELLSKPSEVEPSEEESSS